VSLVWQIFRPGKKSSLRDFWVSSRLGLRRRAGAGADFRYEDLGIWEGGWTDGPPPHWSARRVAEAGVDFRMSLGTWEGVMGLLGLSTSVCLSSTSIVPVK